MSVPARLVAFALVVVLAAGAGYGVGAAVGPVEGPDPASTHDAPMTGEHGG